MCQKCGKPAASSMCGGCKFVSYCSKECQKRDWNAHSVACESIQEEFKILDGKTAKSLSQMSEAEMEAKYTRIMKNVPHYSFERKVVELSLEIRAEWLPSGTLQGDTMRTWLMLIVAQEMPDPDATKMMMYLKVLRSIDANLNIKNVTVDVDGLTLRTRDVYQSTYFDFASLCYDYCQHRGLSVPLQVRYLCKATEEQNRFAVVKFLSHWAIIDSDRYFRIDPRNLPTNEAVTFREGKAYDERVERATAMIRLYNDARREAVAGDRTGNVLRMLPAIKTEIDALVRDFSSVGRRTFVIRAYGKF